VELIWREFLLFPQEIWEILCKKSSSCLEFSWTQNLSVWRAIYLFIFKKWEDYTLLKPQQQGLNRGLQQQASRSSVYENGSSTAGSRHRLSSWQAGVVCTRMAPQQQGLVIRLSSWQAGGECTTQAPQQQGLNIACNSKQAGGEVYFSIPISRFISCRDADQASKNSWTIWSEKKL
jgi:hypothetical protein